jgi:hypothetical protein
MTTKHFASLFVTLLSISANTFALENTDSDLTYLEHVKPILEANCVTCHRPAGTNLGGMIAPMSLASYDEVRPWARSIAKAVASREMPPWHAAEMHRGQFRNERSLTSSEVDTVVAWARSGAARGEGNDVAARFETKEGGWSIGVPDLIIAMPEPFTVGDDVEDLYVDIEVPVPDDLRLNDRWIQALEFKAGSAAVHHLIAYSLRPDGSKIDPGAMLGGIAPGTDADRFPPGYARLWEKGSKLVFEMHYHKEPGAGTGVNDQSQMAIKFAEGEIRHQVVNDNISDYAFEIPAGAAAHRVSASYTFKKDVELLSLLPHMHLRGKSSKYLATYPDGREEVLLDVPRYDFDWQTSYYFEQPKRLPAGTRVDVTMEYDNSAANPNNPDPTLAVRYGEPTTDEMMNGFLNFTNAEPEDFELEGPLTEIDWTLFSSTSQ